MDYGQPKTINDNSGFFAAKTGLSPEAIKDNSHEATPFNNNPERDPRSIGDSAINSLRNDTQQERASTDAELGEIIEVGLPPNMPSGDINRIDSTKIYEDASNFTTRIGFNSDGLNRAGISKMEKLAHETLDKNDAAGYVDGIRGDGGIQEEIMNDAYGVNSALNELVKSSQTIKSPKNNQTNERKAA